MSYPTLPPSLSFCHRGRAYTLRPAATITADRDRYSRAWHRTYGPAYTVEDRRAELVGPSGRVLRQVPLSAFRPGWQKRALAALLPGAKA